MDVHHGKTDYGTPEIGYLADLRKLQEIRKHGGKSRFNIVPPGHPYFVAHIPVGPGEFAQLYFKYYDIMVGLTYREAMAWCRAFGYSYTTYLMRRYQHRSPKLEEIILTIGWYDAGKPVERRDRTTIADFDRLLDGIKQLNTLGGSARGSSTNLGAEYPL